MLLDQAGLNVSQFIRLRAVREERIMRQLASLEEDARWDYPITPSNRHLLLQHQEEEFGTRYYTSFVSDETSTPSAQVMIRSALEGVMNEISDDASDGSPPPFELVRFTNENTCPSFCERHHHHFPGGGFRTLSESSNDSESDASNEVREIVNKMRRNGKCEKRICKESNESGRIHRFKVNKPKPSSSIQKVANGQSSVVPSTFRWVHIEIV